MTPAPTGFTATSGDYQNGYQDDFYDRCSRLDGLAGSDAIAAAARLAAIADGAAGLVPRPQRRVRSAAALGLRRRASTPSSARAICSSSGRIGDSLTFAVTNGVAPAGHADPSAPGFRYDIAADDAVVLPQVPPRRIRRHSSARSLPAYPYFLFFAPGAPLFPLSPFSPSLAVARRCAAHCRFEAALEWYREAFDPLQQDCTWIDCHRQDAPAAVLAPPAAGACCDATDISCDQARDRAVALHYLETLVEWGDALRRRGNSPEAFQQALGAARHRRTDPRAPAAHGQARAARGSRRPSPLSRRPLHR